MRTRTRPLKTKLQCKKCNETILLKSKIKKDNFVLCARCRRQKSLNLKLDIFKNLKQKNEYAQYLYDLYLRYMDRYLLKYELIGQAENFFEYLSPKEVGVLVSWEKVFKESESYNEKYNENKYVVGCPFMKTGKMLAELGVLPPKSEDQSQYYIRVLKKYPRNMLGTLRKFIEFEKWKKLLDRTIIHHLEFILKLINWLEISLFQESKSKLSFEIHIISEVHIQTFLNYLKDKEHTQTYVISAFTALSIFLDGVNLKI